MLETDYLRGLVGGVLIGTASLLAAGATGKIPGISGIFSKAFQGASGDRAWRWVFIVGLIGGAAVTFALLPVAATFRPVSSLAVIVVAGLLVGLGTRLSGGCTSGHGICGMGGGSKSSTAATLVFVAVAMVVVFIVKHTNASP